MVHLRAAAARSLTLALLVIVGSACMVAVQGAPLDPNAFTSLGTLDVSSGTVTINTDTLAISGAAAFTGVVHVQGADLPDMAIFTFDDLTIASGVTLTLQGSRPIAILSKGDATIDAVINARGDSGTSGGGFPTSGQGGLGKLGGGSGTGTNGFATGKGAGGWHLGGNGGRFGGAGGWGGRHISQADLPPPSGSYGNLLIGLEGGSGGGRVPPSFGSGSGGGGAGGGGIEIGAVGALSLGQGVDARGGGAGGASGVNYGGGGGSGGGIILHGETIVTGGTLNASAAGGGAGAAGGGGGGGGRILLAPGVFTAGTQASFNTNVSAGAGNFSPVQNLVDGGPGTPGSVHFAPHWTVIPAGEFLLVDGAGAAVLGPQTMLMTSHRRVEAGGVLFASAPISGPHDLELAGGHVSAPFSWTMTGPAQISGFGQVSGSVAGGATNYIDASGGVLTLGDANSTAGFSVAGDVDIASGATLNLLDADAADLGAETTLAGGARLNSLNGVELGPGEIVKVSAPAEIGGRFNNQGTVNGPTTASEFLTFTDDVDGPGNFTGNVLFSDGFSPGASPAQVSFENVAFDATAKLSIELGGTMPGGQFDQLTVAGDATLGGQLTVSLIDGFSPSIGQSFTILTADDVDGEFTIDPISPLPGLIFDVIYNPQSVVLTVLPAFTADFDSDGDVDGDDLAQWQGDFDANALSDADNDGDSDGDDFLQWQRQLGNSTPATPADDAVPEPSAAALASAALLSVLARVRR